MLFKSKQVSLPKISSILQKMKIGQNSIYALFARNPSWRASCKKGVYRILADFHFFAGSSWFLADWLVLTWKASFCNFFCRLALRSPGINLCKKTQLSSGDLLFNEKQKKPFVSLSFISHIITVIGYYCFVSASDWGAKRADVLWHRFETRSADFFFLFFFLNLFLYLFQKPKHFFKENMQSKLLKVIEICLRKIRSLRCRSTQN